MPLRQRLIASPETLGDFQIAALRRFAEAQQLLVAGRAEGCIYLSGIAAEMWLKVASLRLRGVSPAAPVKAALAPVNTWMTAAGAGVGAESYHSLLFWCEVILRYRLASGRPLPQSLAGPLRHHVANRLFNDWKIDYRYSALPASLTQARRVFADAAWLRQNWQLLWR